MDDELREIIAENILNRRNELDMSQEELARKMGYDRSWAYRREHGLASIDFEEVPRLAEALELDNPLLLLKPDAFPTPRQHLLDWL